MNTQITTGSIGAIAVQKNQSLAETFVSCDVIIMVDTSGSMSSRDAQGGRSRYETACEELASLQKNLPGKIAVFGFSSDTEFCPGGIPTFFGGGTNMVKALRAVKVADLPGMRFILISDGEPDEPSSTLEVARSFQNHIDVIYVGPEERPAGRKFLQELAAATGGKSVTAACADRLAESAQQLLSSGK